MWLVDCGLWNYFRFLAEVPFFADFFSDFFLPKNA